MVRWIKRTIRWTEESTLVNWNDGQTNPTKKEGCEIRVLNILA